jgi:hypothetical protein
VASDTRINTDGALPANARGDIMTTYATEHVSVRVTADGPNYRATVAIGQAEQGITIRPEHLPYPDHPISPIRAARAALTNALSVAHSAQAGANRQRYAHLLPAMQQHGQEAYALELALTVDGGEATEETARRPQIQYTVSDL